MMSKMTRRVGGLLLGAIALPAFACELPKIPLIPEKDKVGDQAATISAATGAYFDGMRSYTECTDALLEAAGGENASPSLKGVINGRLTVAVAEAQAVQKLFQERVGAGQTAQAGSEAALRKLIEGLASGMPDYTAMTPEFAKQMQRQIRFLQPMAAGSGAIQSVEFAGIDTEGRNIFQVVQEKGATNARIALDTNGKIEFALLRPAPKPGERRPTATLPTRSSGLKRDR
jgi:hypothetical protein